MALRHAVLAALLDGEHSGYQLTKIFDRGIANFWYAAPQQLYAELTKLESAELIAGRHVVQQGRPDKRVFSITDAGLAELEAFAARPAKPLLLRDDLAVKVHVVDHIDPGPVISGLDERAETATVKLAFYEHTLRELRGELDEATFLRRGERVGPYLTCLAGCRLEQLTRDWCRDTAHLLRERTSTESRPT
ncbi:PadR family transcriptional regulator [Saccharomonospora sp. NPDC006951]